jgi:hypothetical protein
VVVLPKEKQGKALKVKLCETGSKEASSSLSEEARDERNVIQYSREFIYLKRQSVQKFMYKIGTN